MTNDARRIVWNTRERALSDDLDNATNLLVRQIINNLAFQAAPDELASLNLYGVVNGLLVASTGLALSVTIDIGLAIKYDAGSAGVYDSRYRIIEVTTPITVDVSSHVDPANPRWVVIEVQPGSAIESMSLRDIYNPGNGKFVPQSVPKVMRSAPVVSVRAGAPAVVTPAMPAGMSGRIPLAYVYLPAGALSVNPDHVIRCRPLLTPRLGEQAQNLIGGGFDVATDGDSVVEPSLSVQYRPAMFPAPVSLDAGVVAAAGGLDLAAAGAPAWMDGEVYPASTAPVYLYLMAAPYPAGYDTNLAGREFVPSDQAAAALLIPSYTEGVSGGILAASVTAPVTNSAAVGTHLGLAISGVNDPTWGGGPGASALMQGRVAYVGAVTFHTAFAGLLAQWTENKSHVRFATTPPGAQTQSQSGGGTTFNQLGSFAFTSPLTLTGDRWAPQTANGFEVLHDFEWSGTNPDYVWHLSVEEFGVAFSPVVYGRFVGAGPTALRQQDTNTFNTHAGLFRWETTNNGVDSFDLRVRVWGYDDSMLERT